MTNSVNIRELVLELLLEINEKGTFSHISTGSMLKKHQYLEKSERSFITKVTEGTVENRILIDYIIDRYSSVKTEKQKPVIRNILRMGVYQFLYMDSVPNAAVCNESVKLTVKYGFGSLKGFVNGVLRNIERNIDNIEYPNASDDLILYLSVMYSMPKWIVEQWLYQYGAETASRMIKATHDEDRKNVITVRCNTIKKSVGEIIEMLESENVAVEKNPYYDACLHIRDFDYITKLKTFKDGYISVQDISSMLAVQAASPKEGDYCIDMCAAPGGKSIHLCEMMKGTGMVEARDLTERKVELIRENVARMGVTNIEPVLMDALEYDKASEDKADIVIADLPCSGLGVIRRKGDIKYNMTPEKQDTLVRLQRDILKNAVRYVKKQGFLLFSTCTTNISENIENMEWIKDTFPFEPVSISEKLPAHFRKKTADKGYLQLLQGVDDTDGFFICKLRRTK